MRNFFFHCTLSCLLSLCTTGGLAMAAPSDPTAHHRARLIKYVAARAQPGNELDEPRAIRALQAAPIITHRQAALVRSIVDTSRYDNDFNENVALRDVLRNPQIKAPQAQVLRTLL